MIGLRAALLTLAAGFVTLGACDSGPSERSGQNASAETASVERPTLEEIRADYDEALAKAQATQGPGSPAMWSLSDEDTTIYMFGTVHLLRPEVDWRFPAFDAALAEADTVVFEVDLFSEEGMKAYMSEFMPEGMYQDGRTLREVLNESDEAAIEAGMQAVNVPLDAFNTYEPWMVSVNLGSMQIIADGYDPNSGVEQVIHAEAVRAGKAFAFLEGLLDQLEVFDGMSEDAQIEMLYTTVLTLDSAGETVDHMVAEWADGDIAGLAALAASGEESSPAATEMYERLLVTRNRNWIPVIEGYLDEPGTFFIAAGSAHFAGPDSVILMLEEEGYTVERVN